MRGDHAAGAGDARPSRGAGDAGSPPFSPAEAVGCFLLAAAIGTAIGLQAFPSVLRGSLVNPDTYMRLVRLHDSLARHAFVHVVARDAGGAGTLLHWSHLIDGILLLLAAPFAPFLGLLGGVHAAALMFGPIALGLLAAAAAWVLAPFSDPRWRWLVPLAAATAPAILGFAVPGEVHHHIPVAAAGVMTAGAALRSAWAGGRAGWQLGAWAAIGIWLTPESLPFTLASFAGLGLFWLLHPENRHAGAGLRAGGGVFLLLIAAMLAIDPPFGGYAAAPIERLSIVYLVLGLVLFAIGWTCRRLDEARLPPARRGLLAVIAALALSGLWVGLFPAILAGPYGLLDKEGTRLFFGAISEMQPLETAPEIVTFLVSGMLAAAAAGLIALRRRSPLWGYAALGFCALVVLGYMHRRFATYPQIAAAAMLPVIATCVQRASRRGGAWRAAAPWAVAARFLVLPYLGGLFAGPAAAKPAAGGAAACDPRTLRDVLRPYAGRTMLSDPSDAPGLLYWTDMRTVGSLFHLGLAAFLQSREAWRSMPSDTEPAAVRVTGAAIIVACRHGGRSFLVADLPEETLFDRLKAGNPPPWLEPLAATDAPGYRVYRVRQR